MNKLCAKLQILKSQAAKSIGYFGVLLLSGFACAHDPSWSAPHAPYQITDNIYAVGTEGIGVYLITTPKGHILLDAATEEGAAVVEANIQSLGFTLKDIKYLIENHAHSDHVGGLAQLKKSTGAKLIASKGDRYSLEHGVLDSEADWTDKFPPVKVDKTIADGKELPGRNAPASHHDTRTHQRRYQLENPKYVKWC